ncbi:hypothetical protein TL16_g11037 [Triparma laevis f. inornata]|uniref:Uncharacterized protein n=2 Tax=Triparma laevis TaxID=1534972 RepID=A0A9W7KWR6_9STRA|nr:hypothetical protein TL16_g11037 [Triparma laevis f. inornata]GMI14075.1 hypothetical protein TrLO_g2131 [Triparma laevis f. longispina]
MARSKSRSRPSSASKQIPPTNDDHAPPNSKVSIYWPLEKKYFNARVGNDRDKSGMVTITYTHGDVEKLDMRSQTWKLLERTPAPRVTPRRSIKKPMQFVADFSSALSKDPQNKWYSDMNTDHIGRVARETPKKSKAASSSAKPQPQPSGEHAPPNSRVSIYLPLEKKYFKGWLGSEINSKGETTVTYDDEDVEQLDMRKQAWKLLEQPAPSTFPQKQVYTLSASPFPAPAVPLTLLALTAFSYHMQGGEGRPPTIDWCEKNNEFTPLVKEFFNCLSMFPWIFTSGYGLYKSYFFGAARWVITAYCLSFSIAIGSYLFHAELTRFTQALDELPMLWLGLHSTALFYPVTKYKWTSFLSKKADSVLIVGATVITYLYTCTEQYEHFLLPYSAITVATFLFLLLHMLSNQDSRMKKRGLVGVCSMALGAALWVVELHTCRDWLKLHACWHLGVGSATYYVIGYAAVEFCGVGFNTLFW